MGESEASFIERKNKVPIGEELESDVMCWGSGANGQERILEMSLCKTVLFY